MLPNPIYYSHSSNDSFPRFFPRIADSSNISSSSPSLDPPVIPNSPNETTYTRAPHSPYNLRPLPPRQYNPTKPNINFPP